MADRGRQSAAEFSVVPISAARRPEPPKNLFPDAQEVWTDTVTSLPADWFPKETHPLLEVYCVQVVLHRRLAGMALRPGVPASDVRTLAKEVQSSASVIQILATKMRLTQRSSFDRKKVKHSARRPQIEALDAKTPWNDGDED